MIGRRPSRRSASPRGAGHRARLRAPGERLAARGADVRDQSRDRSGVDSRKERARSRLTPIAKRLSAAANAARASATATAAVDVVRRRRLDRVVAARGERGGEGATRSPTPSTHALAAHAASAGASVSAPTHAPSRARPRCRGRAATPLARAREDARRPRDLFLFAAPPFRPLARDAEDESSPRTARTNTSPRLAPQMNAAEPRWWRRRRARRLRAGRHGCGGRRGRRHIDDALDDRAHLAKHTVRPRLDRRRRRERVDHRRGGARRRCRAR